MKKKNKVMKKIIAVAMLSASLCVGVAALPKLTDSDVQLFSAFAEDSENASVGVSPSDTPVSENPVSDKPVYATGISE